MNIKGLDFYKTCFACPEQYEVYLDKREVGYIRLRWGRLYAEYPTCGGETVYEADIGGQYTGEFESEEQRKEHLNAIADKIWEKINDKNNDV